MASYAPAAVAAATLVFLFWMIPRSIDLTQIYPSVNASYVISLFAAGCLLSHYLPQDISRFKNGAYPSSNRVCSISFNDLKMESYGSSNIKEKGL